MKLLIIIILTGCVFIGYIGILLIRKRHKYLEHKNMSFMESLKLTGFPIISFENNKRFINLLLDTGSNNSIINTNTLKDLIYENLEGNSQVFGLNGEDQKGGYVSLPLGYKGKTYYMECLSINMEPTFTKMKQQFGVTIHGILGTDFFERYKYVLDFNEMIAYSKYSQ